MIKKRKGPGINVSTAELAVALGATKDLLRRGQSAREEYDKIRQPALKQYKKKLQPAKEQYDKIVPPAWEKYKKIVRLAKEQCFKTGQPNMRDYSGTDNAIKKDDPAARACILREAWSGPQRR